MYKLCHVKLKAILTSKHLSCTRLRAAPEGAFQVDIWILILHLEHLVHATSMSLLAGDVQQRVEAALGGALDSALGIHEVRLVAPNKRMLCLSFFVPTEVAFAANSSRTANQHVGPAVHEPVAINQDAAMQQSKRQRT